MSRDPDGWIYASVILAIVSALFGVIGGAFVSVRVFFARDPDERPVMAYLLLSIALVSLSQLLEQTRHLIARASYDGLIDGWWLTYAGAHPLIVSSTKLIIACTLAFASTLKVSLFIGRTNGSSVRFAYASTLVVVLVWAMVGFYLEDVLWAR